MNTSKLKRFVFDKLNELLSDKLTYHGVDHTKEVLNVCNQYIKRMQIPSYEAYLLRTAALMHDFGFIVSYVDHEKESVKFAKKLLPNWDYSEQEIEKIAGMIRATKVPQQPKTITEQIIGDADLDYLGTDEFYRIGNKLYKELVAFNNISTEAEWNKIQLGFLKNHEYHTPFAKKYREPVKQKHLAELMEKCDH